MSVFHDEVEIEDFEYEEETETYLYPCPCGDNFVITKEDLENGEEVATCPSCSLVIKSYKVYTKLVRPRDDELKVVCLRHSVPWSAKECNCSRNMEMAFDRVRSPLAAGTQFHTKAKPALNTIGGLDKGASALTQTRMSCREKWIVQSVDIFVGLGYLCCYCINDRHFSAKFVVSVKEEEEEAA